MRLFDFKCRQLTISDVEKVSQTSNNWRGMGKANKVPRLVFIELTDNQRVVGTAFFTRGTGQWRRDEFCNVSESVDRSWRWLGTYRRLSRAVGRPVHEEQLASAPRVLLRDAEDDHCVLLRGRG